MVHSPAETTYWLISGQVLFVIIPLLGIACFTYIMVKRITPLLNAVPDYRFDHLPARLANTLQFWLGQWKQPRYFVAGVLHIVIFGGFLVLSVRSISLVLMGITDTTMRGWHVYNVVKDYAATLVFLAVVVATIRRIVFKPARYAVPAKYGKSHTGEAILILGLIATLMVSESLFEASGRDSVAPLLTLAWVFDTALAAASPYTLQGFHSGSYLVHELTFFAFLCLLPMGKHFHVITSFFNVYFAKLDRSALKPVRWDVPDEQLENMPSIGVKKFEDFTWKHLLDFYSCADCGRCSDSCPANTVGRPLSPRFLTIKAREYSYRRHPLFGKAQDGQPLIGRVYSEDEIWSCTTCGSCEQECPLMVEYIDKIVDLRRGLVDDGKVPQSLQKPLKALESRGNPYGKLDKKRADWAKDKEFQQACAIRTLKGDKVPQVRGAEGGANLGAASTLYFVDSVTSYDDRMQSIARATARVLGSIGEDFGILGPAEKDSGHEVRRFGEELLFQSLREHNTEAIKATGVQSIVTADPHAYNALKHDYKDLPPVEHISQVIARELRDDRLKLSAVEDGESVFTYHDPCYLGRHNQVYDDPRYVLDSIPGLKRVEMERCRDRSFCCGGGGLMLFYEPKEEQRMGVVRVRMAAEAGANVIVTACPFCMANIEDAIKVAGLEGQMTAIDLVELVDKHVVREAVEAPG